MPRYLAALVLLLGCGPEDSLSAAEEGPDMRSRASNVSMARYTDVWMIAGQSNASGKGSKPSLPTSPVNLQNAQTDILYSQTINGGSVLSLVALQPDGNSHGVEITFGRALADAGRRVGILKWAYDGSGLENTWLGGAQYYNTAKTFWQGELASFPKPWRVRGLIWIHGESDGNNSGRADRYTTNLDTLAANFRADFGANAIMLLNKLHVSAAVTYGTTVRARQGTFVSADAHASIIDGDDLALKADALHYASADLQALGSRFASAALSLTP